MGLHGGGRSAGRDVAEEFLKPLGMSNYRLAKEIGVPAQPIGEILPGKRAIDGECGARGSHSRWRYF
jgi:plasmid maintenance system antidote protein VapI